MEYGGAAAPPRNRLPAPRTLAMVAVVLLPFFGLWLWGRLERDRIEHKAAAVASVLAGRPVQVRCPGPFRRHVMFEDTEGSVQFDADGRPGDSTTLSARTCDGLKAAMAGGPRLDLGCLQAGCPPGKQRIALALTVLAHESMHLAGIANEAQAECRANDHVVFVARSYGLSARDAAAVKVWQKTVQDPQLPDSYRGC